MLSRRLARAAILATAAVVLPGSVHAEEEPAAADPSPTAGAADGTTASPVAETPGTKHRKRKARPEDDRTERGMTVPWRAAATAGVMSGSGTLVERAVTSGVAGELEPTLQRGALELRLPVKVDHRQAFAGSLTATDGRAGVAATYRKSPRLRIGGAFELRGVWKPNWPDQYQPAANGGLGETDRYSHLDISLGAAATLIPRRHWHARVAWEVGLVDYADDPSFDMIDEPTHLVPGDHTKTTLEADGRYFGDGWKAGVGLDLAYTSHDFQYARDAGTGLTHAGAGGPPPNPFYQEAALEPKLVADLDLAGGDGELDLSYGYEIVSDRYQGYYSYRGHHPEAKLTWQIGELEAAIKADLKWRTYGPDSYAPGPGHPPLEYGDRRVDHRFGSGVDVRRALTAHWTIIGEADAIIRRTNFPNYVPNMFPASRQYDIEWSYENYVIQAGVEYH